MSARGPARGTFRGLPRPVAPSLRFAPEGAATRRGHEIRRGAVTSAPGVRKRVVERYIAGFRAADREMILACLTDDVGWETRRAFDA